MSIRDRISSRRHLRSRRHVESRLHLAGLAGAVLMACLATTLPADETPSPDESPLPLRAEPAFPQLRWSGWEAEVDPRTAASINRLGLWRA